MKNQMPYTRNPDWPDGMPKYFMEYVLVQCVPMDSAIIEWPKRSNGDLTWATVIPAGTYLLGMDWNQAFPFAGLIGNLEEWLAANPGRWKFRIWRAVRHDRCHR